MKDEETQSSQGHPFSNTGYSLEQLAKEIADSTFSVFSADELSKFTETTDTFLDTHARSIGYERKFVVNAGYTWFPLSVERSGVEETEDRYRPTPLFTDATGLATAFASEYWDTFKAFLTDIHDNDGIALSIVLVILLERSLQLTHPLGPSPIEKVMRMFPVALKLTLQTELYGAHVFEGHSRGGRKGAGRSGTRTGGTDQELGQVVRKLLEDGVSERELNSEIRERYHNKFGGERHLRNRLKTLGITNKKRH